MKGPSMEDGRKRDKKHNDAGATAVEYALILSLLVLALIAGLDSVGSTTVNNLAAAANSYPSS